MNKKNVLVILISAYINDSRVSKISKSLSENNYNVNIKAIHNGNEHLEYKFKEEDVLVERLKLFSKKLPKAFQFIKYIELTLRIAFQKEKYDVIHCNDFAPLPLSFFYKTFVNRNVKIVYDAHEYQAEVNNIKKVQKKFIELFERIFVKRVDLFITVSKGILSEYKNKHQIRNYITLYNTPDNIKISNSTNKLKKELNLDENNMILLFQGNLSTGRGIEKILKYFNNADIENIDLVFMGNGKLEKLIKSYQNKNIHHLPAVDKSVLQEYTGSADVGIVPYENTCLNHYYCLPNKLFEYIHAGLPVIVNNLNDLEQIVLENSVGWVIDIDNELDFEKLINKSILNYNNMDENIVRFKHKYNWSNEKQKLIENYKKLGT